MAVMSKRDMHWVMNYSHLRHGKGPQRRDAWRFSEEIS
jgi:hypothetical protein